METGQNPNQSTECTSAISIATLLLLRYYLGETRKEIKIWVYYFVIYYVSIMIKKIKQN